MTKALTRTLALIAMVASSRSALAQRGDVTQAMSSDTTAVLGAVQRLFDAINSGDTTILRGLLVPGMQLVALADPPPATGRARIQSDSAFAQLLGARRQRYHERMWQPVVRIQGAIATVWAPYDFHVDGAFSHCGVDTFTLLHSEQGWQIATVVYTVQRTGCAPSPLGPPT